MRKAQNLANISQQPQDLPIFVDLDGTLLKTDTIFELLILLLKHKFSSFLLSPFWLLKGRSYFKAKISKHVKIDPKLLPYNLKFLNYLRKQARKGRLIYLATGSFHAEAKAIADHLGIFNDVLASDDSTNLIGLNKLKAIKAFTNNGPFIYAGNSGVDLIIWNEADQAIVVRASLGLKEAASAQTPVIKYFPASKNLFQSLLNALRVYQWVKNLLLFIPLLMAHKITDFFALIQVSFGFLAFNCIASGVYICNDLLDLHNDRQHPTKRRRPYAAGDLPLWTGFVLFPILLSAGFWAAFWLDKHFFLLLAAYFAITCAYSFKLKSLATIDVICLSVLYTWRVLTGGVLANVEVSPWLLAFCCFLFYSLALAKRSAELLIFISKQNQLKTGRNYLITDLPIINTIGIASSCMAVLVFALYISSSTVQSIYKNPEFLWPICLALLYWTSRIWIITNRGKMHQDPIVFALKDKASHATLVIITILFSLASISFE